MDEEKRDIFLLQPYTFLKDIIIVIPISLDLSYLPIIQGLGRDADEAMRLPPPPPPPPHIEPEPTINTKWPYLNHLTLVIPKEEEVTIFRRRNTF